ncbi:MAG: hypothetical protein O2954_14220 [bacterium]|nr:hypothetical protein [bacterium]
MNPSWKKDKQKANGTHWEGRLRRGSPFLVLQERLEKFCALDKIRLKDYTTLAPVPDYLPVCIVSERNGIMTQENPENPAFSEDDEILSRLTDPVDIEAFSNLMQYAHEQGISATDFVREEPKRTSRKAIQKLCLKNRKRSLRAQIESVVRGLWERPAENPEAAMLNGLFGPASRPPEAGRNGQHRKV